jgi:hypothetical protein
MGLDDIVDKAKDLAGDAAEKAKDIAGDVADRRRTWPVTSQTRPRRSRARSRTAPTT